MNSAAYVLRFVFFSLLLLGVVGIFSPGNYSVIQSTIFIELLFFTIIVVFGRAGFLKQSYLFFFLIFYLCYNFFVAIVVNKANILDLVISIKFFFYALVFCLLLENRQYYLSGDVYRRFFYFLAFLFSAKYLVVVFVFGGTRPGLFVENNFELLFLFVYVTLLWARVGDVKFVDVLILALLVVLSGSRSAALSVLPVFVFFAFIGFKSDLLIRSLVMLSLLAVSSLVLFFVVSARIEEGASIFDADRFQFLEFLLQEIDTWGVKEYIFGSQPITPLSDFTCRSLLYYENLFSYGDDRVCYSVILHSMLFRTFFDHGLFGVFFCFWLVFYFSSRLGCGGLASFVIVSVVFVNSLSVSGYNSVYFWLPFSLFLFYRDRG